MKQMKKLITLTLLLVIGIAGVQAQSIQKLFDKYMEDERFSYVSVGQGAMNMAAAFIPKDDGKAKGAISKMTGVKILSLENGSDEKLIKSVMNDLDRIIKKENFEALAETRSKGERMNIYFQTTGKDNSEMLIVTQEEGEMNIIWLTGKMTKEEMSGMVSN